MKSADDRIKYTVLDTEVHCVVEKVERNTNGKKEFVDIVNVYSEKYIQPQMKYDSLWKRIGQKIFG